MNYRNFALLTVFILAALSLGLLFGFVGGTRAAVYDTPSSPDIDPTVTDVQPASAPNDINTPIVIQGTGFSATLSGTQVITAPTVYLGDEGLVDVIWANTTTLSATVPWGLVPEVYSLTVVNPDGISATLQNAFTVTQGFGVFTTGGPYGGMTVQLKQKPDDPTSIYAAMYGVGLFISEDAGENWELIADQDYAYQLDFDSEDSNVLYMSAESLSRSMDNGASWKPLLEDFHFQNGCYQSYAVAHPDQKGYVYAGIGSCRSIPLEPDEGGVYFSTDYGDNWVARNTSLSDRDIQALAIHPLTPTIMLAGTFDGDLFYSTNSGTNWTWSTQLTGTVSRLYFNPYETLEAWAISRTDTDPHAGGEGYLYRSTNLVDWETFAMNIQPGGPAHAQMDFLPASVWLASGSVYSTTDSGVNWNEIYSPIRGANSIAISPDNPQIIFMGTDYGIEKTTNGGGSWQAANEGLAALVPYAITVSPDDPDTVYVKTHQDIFVSFSGGNEWLALDHSDGTYPGGTDLAVDRFQGTQLYLTFECQGEFCIDTSPDGGATWNVVTSTLPLVYTDKRCGSYVITPSPHTPGQVLVGASLTPPNGGEYSGIFYRSDDYGASWSYITLTQTISRITELAYDAFNPNLIFAGTDGTGLWRSTDGGDNWAHVPISNTLSPVSVAAIATHPDIPDKVYLRSYSFATTSNPEPEMWVSEDTGDTWQPLAYVFIGVDLLVSPPIPDQIAYTLYTGGADRNIADSSGLYQSYNDGQSWQSIPGAPRPEILTAASDGERSIIYLGTPGGLAASAGGETTFSDDAVLSNVTIFGGGVYRLTMLLPTDWVYLPIIVR